MCRWPERLLSMWEEPSLGHGDWQARGTASLPWAWPPGVPKNGILCQGISYNSSHVPSRDTMKDNNLVAASALTRVQDRRIVAVAGSKVEAVLVP